MNRIKTFPTRRDFTGCRLRYARNELRKQTLKAANERCGAQTFSESAPAFLRTAACPDMQGARSLRKSDRASKTWTRRVPVESNTERVCRSRSDFLRGALAIRISWIEKRKAPLALDPRFDSSTPLHNLSCPGARASGLLSSVRLARRWRQRPSRRPIDGGHQCAVDRTVVALTGAEQARRVGVDLEDVAQFLRTVDESDAPRDVPDCDQRWLEWPLRLINPPRRHTVLRPWRLPVDRRRCLGTCLDRLRPQSAEVKEPSGWRGIEWRPSVFAGLDREDFWI